MPTIQTLSDANFDELALNSQGLCLIEAWAPSCGPCKAQKAITERLAREREDIQVFRADAQNNPRFALYFEVRAVPTLIVLIDGQLQRSLLGPHSYDELQDILDKFSQRTGSQRLAG